MKKKSNLIYIAAATAMLNLTSCGGVTEETSSSEAKVFSVSDVLAMVAKENDVTRTMYTKVIVGGLKPQGFKFDENWMEDTVEAGPLPALFLRGISASIQKGTIPLGLYLGSDFPINDANKLQGKQAELFTQIKMDKKPQFFFDEESKLHTAMFADVAGAAPCVDCHNKHAESPKKDWALGDVMGATTWQYPSDSLSYQETMDVLKAYRDGTRAIYAEFVDEISNFSKAAKPEIGTKWPSEGYFLPSAEVFIDSVRKITSYPSMKKLML